MAASWSANGLSRLLIERAEVAGWKLVTADYCLSEVEKNVRKHVAGAAEWKRIVRPQLTIVVSVYVIDRPIVFDATKDKPVILSAIGVMRCIWSPRTLPILPTSWARLFTA